VTVQLLLADIINGRMVQARQFCQELACIQTVEITASTSHLRTLGGHRRYPAAPLRDLAASLGYQLVLLVTLGIWPTFRDGNGLLTLLSGGGELL
jgi:hypothetical protein